MKTFLKREGLILTLLMLTVLASLYAWPRVPESLAVHWDINGEPDRYGSRLEALFILPLAILGSYLVLMFIPRLDKRNQQNTRVLQLVRDTVTVGLAALHLGIVANYLGANFSVSRMVAVIVGTILLGVGNWLPKLEPNAWAGLRVPWVFKSQRAWYAGQRLSGWLLSLSGLAMVLIGFFTAASWALLLLVVVLMLGILCVTAYTFHLWRTDPQAERS